MASSPEEAAQRAAAWLQRRIASAVRLRGVARLAVSGGSTPVLMFDRLAAMDMPWKDVQLYQVDERVAPDADPDRNAVDLVQHLVSPARIPKRNVHLMPVTARSLGRAGASYAAALGATPLDVVHLGVGDDGHTASWPPGDPVADSTQPVAISGVFNGRVRMTLTPPVVNRARARLILVSGANKAEPIAGWLIDGQQLPVARVRRTNTTLIGDSAAMARLPKRLVDRRQ